MRMWYLPENAPSAKTTIISAIAATTVIGLGLTNELFPGAINHYVSTRLRNFLIRSQLTVVIEEFDGLAGNQMFDAATVYFGTKVSPSIKRIKVTKPEKEKELAVTVDKNQEIIDVFQGAKFKWVSLSKPIKQLAGSNERPTIINSRSELRVFEVTFHKKHRDMVLKSYLPYILQKAKEIKLEKKTLKLHTVDYNGTDYWSWTNLDHPSTFDTMAMDPETKKDLLEDLDMFIERKEYYRRVGKAWKRGYLFYGPPGTGKSSLVAAMANYLKFDVYDLDLREVQCNSDLRRLLIGTGNRSILVIEDIDCSVKLENREAEKEAQVGEDDKITLSGLLNFIDGLWSSCGDERIIVFTTNRKDRIDPALLRPGRMDLHIHMSYCNFAGFKVLASNYLGIQDHPLYGEIEELIRWAQATPAKVAGELMKRNNVDVALQGLIKLLQST